MKSSILFLFSFMSFSVFLSAQSITSIQIQPPDPTSYDDLLVIVQLEFPFSPCSKVSSSINPPQPQPGDTIEISGFYCHEFDPSICTLTDTFNLGQLAEGFYYVNFSMYSRNIEGNCGGFFLYDIDNVNIAVDGIINGINSASAEGGVKVYPNPVREMVYFEFDEHDNFNISIFDTKGLLVKEITVSGKNEVSLDVSDLPDDIYFYTVKTQKEITAGKFVIAR